MNNSITLNKFQREFVDSVTNTNKHTVAINGAGAGSTTALIFAWSLIGRKDPVLFKSPYKILAMRAEYELNFEDSSKLTTSLHGLTGKTVFVDNLSSFTSEECEWLYDNCRVIAISSPNHVQINYSVNDGDITDNSSSIKCMFNWEKLGKLHPSNVKDNVHLIYGYDYKVNKYLDKDYLDCLMSLPNEYDSLKYGAWTNNYHVEIINKMIIELENLKVSLIALEK